jgi:hypothetical protein
MPFTLQFPLEQMQQWADRYPGSDESVYEAGRKIRAGDYSRENLEEIVRWKSPRRAGLIANNTDAEIADALRLAVSATESRSAFAVLLGLSGVGTPVASAILMSIDPNRYTVIDWRALEALGTPELDTDLNCYLNLYLPECERLAKEAKISLRILDRALWSWSKFNGMNREDD